MEVEKWFSWRKISGNLVIKIIDKSFLDYGETIIPHDIREYFKIEKYSSGDQIEVKLVYNGKEYDGKIIFENNFNRSKLKLSHELKQRILNSIDKYNIKENKFQAIFIRDKFQHNKYHLSVVMEV